MEADYIDDESIVGAISSQLPLIDQVWDLTVLNHRTGERTPLGHKGWFLRVSPDQTKLAWLSPDATQVYRAALEAGQPATLVQTMRLDGSRLQTHYRSAQPHQTRIIRVPLDGSEPVPVISLEGGPGLILASGRRVAVTALTQRVRAWVATVDTSGSLVEPRLAFPSPDGSQIAYGCAGQDIDTWVAELPP